MAAPHLLVLTELIAPFIPLGLCGSLSVIAAGLSLLLPSCWRKPLPNTIDEAENRIILTLKETLRDLTAPKFGSLNERRAPSVNNIYTIHPTFPKMEEPAYCEHDLLTGDDYYEQPSRPIGIYNDDTDSRLSDMEEAMKDGNWRLVCSRDRPGPMELQERVEDRLRKRNEHLFTRYSMGNVPNPQHVQVAETNL